MEGSNKKSNKNKLTNENYNNKTNKKRQREEDNIEDVVNNPDEKLSKSFNKMDFSDESDGFESKSDSEEEVVIDQDHYDESEDDEEEARDVMDEDIDTTKENKNKVKIWEGGKMPEEGMELDFDNEAYDMLHRARVEWPCMSIDFILPEFANINESTASSTMIPSIYKDYKSVINKPGQDKYPYNCYMVAGSQTTAQNGYIYCMKWYNMQKTRYDDDPDKEADSDEEEGQDPFLKFEKVQIKGNINKIRSMKNSYLCGLWSDSPAVEIVDTRSLLAELEYSNNNKNNNKKRKINTKNIVLKSFTRNQEGFAINWANHLPGVLAAGGRDRKIEIYYPTDENFSDWTLTSKNQYDYKDVLKGHKGSIEDVIWSPIQAHVLASCSTDKSIRFWDLRNNNTKEPIVIEAAHTSDVNCIAWNNFSEFLVASGGDDGAFKVWDIRYINNGPITNIQWHKGPITSLQWDNFEDSQIAVASEDNKLSIWDFAVEPDDNQLFDYNNKEIPQQLVFLHQGQENIKEVKFHPIFKDFVASTAESGINVFKPAFDDDNSMIDDDEEMETE